MAPITVDFSDDFNPAIVANNGPSPAAPASQNRTLLLAPPSIAAHEERLSALFSTQFDRSTTDLHMIDRLAAGLVTLPPATYDLILVLTDPDGSRYAEAAALLAGRAIWASLVSSLKTGGTLRSEDGSLGANPSAPAAKEAVLAGLVAGFNGFTKPADEEEAAVPLRFGLKRKNNAVSGANPVTTKPATPIPTFAAAPATVAAPTAAPVGVGFVDFSDDLDLDGDDDDDDALVDEDTLLTEEDMRRPIVQPPECAPAPGKKRRACKDCTCGLAARLEAEDKARRAKAEKDRDALKLKSEDLNELEMDLTVPGKTGSCGSCALGDAFRCADCPYIGLPAFKPGEEVMILNNVAQL